MGYNHKEDIVGLAALFLILVCLILISPIITIWSLNTLFYTTIPTNVWTYLATLWLTGLIAGGNILKK